MKGREQKELGCGRSGCLFETHTVPQTQSRNAPVAAPGSAKNDKKEVPVLSSPGARGCCTATTSLHVDMIEDKEKEINHLLLQSQWCLEVRAWQQEKIGREERTVCRWKVLDTLVCYKWLCCRICVTQWRKAAESGEDRRWCRCSLFCMVSYKYQ